MKVSSIAEMREMDRTAIERYGIAGEILMENAGLAVVALISERFSIAGKKFLVFCGLGNNGGDGFVIARKLHSDGGSVKVYILGDRKKYRGAAKTNLDILSRLPIEIAELQSVTAISKEVSHCDLIVDAIFGTGLSKEVGGIHREVIEQINGSRKTVFSVDIPSGVHGDNGQIMGGSVQADYTVAFGLPKRGNLLYPGFERCGELYVTHISFTPSLYDNDSLKVAVNTPVPLPTRIADGHKGDFGEALFIAGASSYFGAPYFAALSFLKAGGGYSRLASPKSITPFIANRGSEIVFVPQRETPSGSISYENKAALLELAAGMDVIILGPGTSLDEETGKLMRELLREIEKPIILDGDGITALSEHLNLIAERKEGTVLTPHMGEMSRITRRSISELKGDPISILQHTASELNACIVLKGAHTLIGCPDQQVFINMSGNSGMATAGSGDVLTGTIAAMYCLGLSLYEAARKGVFIHGLSGDIAAREMGADGMTAQDILESLPAAMKFDREHPEEISERYCGARTVL